MRRTVAWALAVGILLLAGVVVALQPREQLIQGPFSVDVALEQEGTGRNIAATFHSIALAEVVEPDSFSEWRGESEGVWVVVDATVASRVDNTILNSFLLIGDDVYRGSERSEDGLESWSLSPGLPVRGTILFEVSPEVLESATSARIMVGARSDWRLDSVIATTVDLSSLVVEDTLLIAPVERIAP